MESLSLPGGSETALKFSVFNCTKELKLDDFLRSLPALHTVIWPNVVNECGWGFIAGRANVTKNLSSLKKQPLKSL